jgi:hypothetical protein
MIKLCLLFNKTIFWTNVPVSVLLTILASLLAIDPKIEHSVIFILIFIFILCIMTGGFLLSIFYNHLYRKNEYYFYYNFGLSKLKLISAAYIFHFVFITPLIVILFYV